MPDTPDYSRSAFMPKGTNPLTGAPSRLSTRAVVPIDPAKEKQEPEVQVVDSPQVRPAPEPKAELWIFLAGLVILAVGATPIITWPYVGWIVRIGNHSVWAALAVHLLTPFVIHCIRVWLRTQQSPIGARLATWLISRSLHAGPISSSQQRQIFEETPVFRSTTRVTHTHGISAAHRNAAVATAGVVAASLGLEPYYIQRSLADQRKSRDGDRSYHWPKDLAIEARDFHFDAQKQVAVLVDVDYYLNLVTLLAAHPGTYLIAAFQPTAAAKGEGDYTFRFEDDAVIYQVSGGSTFVHKVWNYAGDTIVVDHVSYFTKRVVAYHIDRKYMDSHHCLVMLSVIGQFKMPIFLPTSMCIRGDTLQRLQPCIGEHVLLDIVSKQGRSRSIAIAGHFTAVTLPVNLIDAVVAVTRVSKQDVSPFTVASNISPTTPLGMSLERLPPGHAAIVTDFLRAVLPRPPPYVCAVEESMLVIRYAKHDYLAKVPLKAFGTPLIEPCFSHVTSIASDDRCIAGRVEKFTADLGQQMYSAHPPPPDEQPMLPTLAAFMQEFVKLLIPVPHTGVPVDMDHVYDKQHRPSQRSKLARAEVSGPAYTPFWSAFLKKETYQKVTDPRNISMGNAVGNMAYSCYMYAFHDEVMTKQEWYAFNKTPRQVAERLCAMLADATHAAMGDGSRFDGHVKILARLLERMCMLRFFAHMFHANVCELMDQQMGLSGATTEGRKYKSFFTRGSGSSETADFNSIITAFIGYCAWRNTRINGATLTPEQAWRKMGLYGGDDSAEGAVDPLALKKSAELMGQEYEIEVVQRGCLGVNFLNRQFGPDVFFGDPNSMANPKRLLAKLWVGPAVLHNPLERFIERCSGYNRMDRYSPVIGDIVTLADDLCGARLEGELMPWNGTIDGADNWPNYEADWMTELFNIFIPDFNFDMFYAYCNVIESTQDPALLLTFPKCVGPRPVPEVNVPCGVGDELLFPAPVTPATPAADPAAGVFADVHLAASTLPVLTKDGSRAKRGSGEQASKSTVKVAVDFKDPRNWTAPVRFAKETDVEYAKRTSDWAARRKHVAKKLGIKLVDIDESDAVKQGSFNPYGNGQFGSLIHEIAVLWFACVLLMTIVHFSNFGPIGLTSEWACVRTEYLALPTLRYGYYSHTWTCVHNNGSRPSSQSSVAGTTTSIPAVEISTPKDDDYFKRRDAGTYHGHVFPKHHTTAMPNPKSKPKPSIKLRDRNGKLVSERVIERAVVRAVQSAPPRPRPRPSPLTVGPKFRNGSSNAGFSRVTASAAPVAYGEIIRTARPLIRATKDGWNIQHSEFAFTFVASGTFCSAFANIDTPSPGRVNPGNMLLFPWLAKFASRAEMYKFRYLRFRIVTKTSTSEAGSTYMAFDLDAADAVPTNPVQIMNYEGAASGPVWSNAVNTTLDIKDARVGSNTRYMATYYQATAVQSSNTNRLNDVASFFLYAGGLGSDITSASLCDVYVDYDVDLIVPQISSSLNTSYYANRIANISNYDWTNNLVFGSTVTQLSGTVPMGYGGPVRPAGNQGSAVNFVSLGDWVMRITWSGGVINPTGLIGLTDCSQLVYFSGGITSVSYGLVRYNATVTSGPTTVITGLYFTFGFTVTDANNSFSLLDPSFPSLFSTAPTNCALTMTERGTLLL